MVVPRFVQSALKNEPVLIYGTGKQTRCFCNVSDVIEAIIKLVDCQKAAGKVFNIGTNQEIAIEKLADIIIHMTKSKSIKQFVPYETAYGRPIEDMMRRVPSLERIENTIGWKPRKNLDETLQEIIEHEKLKLKK